MKRKNVLVRIWLDVAARGTGAVVLNAEADFQALIKFARTCPHTMSFSSLMKELRRFSRDACGPLAELTMTIQFVLLCPLSFLQDAAPSTHTGGQFGTDFEDSA